MKEETTSEILERKLHEYHLPVFCATDKIFPLIEHLHNFVTADVKATLYIQHCIKKLFISICITVRVHA